MLEIADVVVSMAESDTIPEYILNNKKVVYWDMIDPFNRSLEFTRQVRNQIQTLVEELISELD